MECKNCEKQLESDWGICPWCSTKVERNWADEVYNNDSLWYQTAFDSFPEIIACEYKRLSDLFKEEKTYGAFFQIKDLFEILLKLPTLALVSQIHYKKEHSKEEKELLKELVKKPLSLGTWQTIGNKIKKLDDLIPEIVEIEKSILNIYNNENIVKWRNDEIGHGALGFDCDDKFKEDIEKKLKLIKEHLAETEGIYAKLEFVAEKEVTETEVYLDLNSKNYKLTPYIFYDDDKFYFFDTYLSKKESSSILDYMQGAKFKKVTPEITNLYKRLYNTLGEYNDNFDLSVEEDILLKQAEKILTEANQVNDYVGADGLKNWLQETIASNNNGLFLLQMEGGTGKTTFARALDQRELDKFKGFGKKGLISRRAYYINDSYNYKFKKFKSDLIDELRASKKEENEITGDFPELKIDFQDKSKNRSNFAELLGGFAKLHSKFFGTEGLLFIIDGLDEIPMEKDEEQKLSIFDFIPREEELPENVYILLTSRTDEELEDYHRERISELNISSGAKLIVKKEDQKNRKIIEDYVKDQLKIKESDKIEEVLEAADYKLLYLSLFKIIRDSGNASLEELKKADNKFMIYFDLLKSMYGEKLFKRIKRVLSIIATSFEPLTAKEISYLLGEEKLTFRFLAMLSDLRPLLKVERSSRGNLISLNHQFFKVRICNEYEDDIAEMVRNWWKQFLQFDVQNVDLNDSGEIYLITYMGFYLEEYLEFIKYEDEFRVRYLNLLISLVYHSKEFIPIH
ncbi:hypothetical protein MWH28_12305 [Natroniella sulfidigena]|uniref:hypothetical protein n=1 Tax=Natroniella sulfidigena TaxID=723921 RepID=UPI00200AE7CA|nr:hypothetical protein [Natroniella sulfidigena]MCK8818139.1 hypothetical protein [Natroniella sulfidigena]